MKCHTSSQPGTYVPQDQGLERDWPGVSAERESLLCRVLEKKKRSQTSTYKQRLKMVFKYIRNHNQFI